MAEPSTRQGPRVTRKEQAALTKARLLEAALELFSAHPYDDVNVADIARAADAAHGLLFHHFGSKREIYLAALEQFVGAQKVRRQADLDRVDGSGLRAALQAHLDSIAATPEPFLRVMTVGVSGDPEAHAIVERDRWDAIEALSHHLGLPSSSPAVKVVLRGAVGGIDQTVLTWLSLGRPYAFERLLDALVEIIDGGINGLRSLEPGADVDRARGVVATARSAASDL